MEMTIVFQYRDGKYDGIYGLFMHTTNAEYAIEEANAEEAQRLEHDPESKVKFTYGFEEGFVVDDADSGDDDDDDDDGG